MEMGVVFEPKHRCKGKGGLVELLTEVDIEDTAQSISPGSDDPDRPRLTSASS